MTCDPFLSTPSGWRATRYNADRMGLTTDISIHALRVEGDGVKLVKENYNIYISIHALRVEGDLERVQRLLNHSDISIHALRVEGDRKNGQSFCLFLRKREKNLPL